MVCGYFVVIFLGCGTLCLLSPLIATSLFWYVTTLLPDSLTLPLPFQSSFWAILLLFVLYMLILLRIQILILSSHYILSWGCLISLPRVPFCLHTLGFQTLFLVHTAILSFKLIYPTAKKHLHLDLNLFKVKFTISVTNDYSNISYPS